MNIKKAILILFMCCISLQSFGDKLQDQARDILSNIKLNSGGTALDKYVGVANYNSNYEIIQWSCGLPCKLAAVINLDDGSLVDTIESCYGISYSLASRKIIFINKPEPILHDCYKGYQLELVNGKLVKNT